MSDNKNNIGLVITGCVFIAVNALVFTGSRAGHIAPVDNLFLWGVFATLSVFALLWSIRLLGMQPMVVAVSYATGGWMAFQGVNLMPNVHVAEIATAGATYGAFGAMVVGGATAKVRMAFIARQQVPFVVVILVLLLVDALLNSRVSNAGWGVVTNALILPFLLCGVVVGLAWMVGVRVHVWRKSIKELSTQAAEETAAQPEDSDLETEPLMFAAPEDSDENAFVEPVAFETEPVTAGELEHDAPGILVKLSDGEEDTSDDSFFPLEIDNGEDTLAVEEDESLMNMAAMVAERSPERGKDEDFLIEKEPSREEPVASEELIDVSSDESPEANGESANIEAEPEETISNEKEKVDSNDWLNSHLDLLSKLK